MTLRSLDWRGPEVVAAVMRAAQEAVDETTEAAARDAAASAARRTGRLAANVVNEPAVRRGLTVVGKFGSTHRQGFYGLILERRGRPFLRPAADRNFSNLARRIKARVR